MANGKILNAENLVSLGKLVITIVAGAFAIVVFYFVAEIVQNRDISDQRDALTKVTTALSDHLDASKETFDKLNQMLTKSTEKLAETSEALVKVSTIQQTLKEENTRLSEDMKETTKALVEVSVIQKMLKKENGRIARSVEDLAAEVRKNNRFTAP